MVQIGKTEVELLVRNKIIRNSSVGYVDSNGNTVGFYNTKNKRYIEDKYAEIAQKLHREKKIS